MAEDFKTGTLGKATVGTTDINITEWSIDPKGEKDETTHTGSAGYETWEPTTKGCSGSFKFKWDANAKPTTAPPALLPGTKVLLLKLYIGDPTDAVYHDFPEVVIDGLPMVSNVKAVVDVTCNWTANGTFTLAGET